MSATTKQQLRQRRASFSTAMQRRAALKVLRDLAAKNLGKRAKVIPSDRGRYELWIDGKRVLASRMPADIERAISDAGILLRKQRRMELGR